MNLKHLKIAIGVTCTLLAVVLVFRARIGGGFSGEEIVTGGSEQTSVHLRSSRAGHGRGSPDSNRGLDAAFPQEPKALELPVLPVDEKRKEQAVDDVSLAVASRKLRTEDDILAMGGVVPVAKNSSANNGSPGGGPRSIKSSDWKGLANLLVKALRAGDRFEVNHD